MLRKLSQAELHHDNAYIYILQRQIYYLAFIAVIVSKLHPKMLDQHCFSYLFSALEIVNSLMMLSTPGN